MLRFVGKARQQGMVFGESRRWVSIVDSTKAVLTARCPRTTNSMRREWSRRSAEAVKGWEDQPEVQAQVMYVRPHAPKPCKLF